MTDEDREIAAAAGEPPRAGARWRLDDAFLLVAIVGILIARIPVIPVRFFDQDEFEHAHAAWSVFKGLLPYRDFFEHHTPWYYFALAPFFRWFAVDQSFDSARHFLSFARGLSLALTALSAVLVFLRRTARGQPPGGSAGGAVPRRAAGGDPEDPRDPPRRARASVLPGRALVPAARAPRTRELSDAAASRLVPRRRALLRGRHHVHAEDALRSSRRVRRPRALGAGRWPANAWRARILRGAGGSRRRRRSRARSPGSAFAVQGGGHQFIYNNFLLNAQWRMRSGRHLLDGARDQLADRWPWVSSGRPRRWSASIEPGGARMATSCCSAPWAGSSPGSRWCRRRIEQYYLMPLPIACVFAAQGLCPSRRRGPANVSRGWLVVGATALLLIWPVVDLTQVASPGVTTNRWRGCATSSSTRRRRTPVLDGWLGTAVFRPHPLYYFFMHGELLAMLTGSDKDAYLDALESGRVRPALIALDDELVRAGPALPELRARHYVSGDGLFYLRRRASRVTGRDSRERDRPRSARASTRERSKAASVRRAGRDSRSDASAAPLERRHGPRPASTRVPCLRSPAATSRRTQSFVPLDEGRHVARAEGGQLVQLPREAQSQCASIRSGDSVSSTSARRAGPAMGEPAIGEHREVDDSEFVAAEREAADVRREDGRVWQVRGGRDTTEDPAGLGVGVGRDPEAASRATRRPASPKETPSSTGRARSAYKPTATATRSRLRLAFTHDENTSETSSNASGNAKYGMRP